MRRNMMRGEEKRGKEHHSYLAKVAAEKASVDVVGYHEPCTPRAGRRHHQERVRDACVSYDSL